MKDEEIITYLKSQVEENRIKHGNPNYHGTGRFADDKKQYFKKQEERFRAILKRFRQLQKMRENAYYERKRRRAV